MTTQIEQDLDSFSKFVQACPNAGEKLSLEDYVLRWRGPSKQVCIPRIFPNAKKATSPSVANLDNAERSVLEIEDSMDRLGIDSKKKWHNKVLRCRFLDGTDKQSEKVRQNAQLWEPHCNIKFEFGESRDSEIRISFNADPGSWSAVGTDALLAKWFPLNQPTMNFGWLRDDTDDVECRRVVVHEFGHALGAIHEHQQPNASLKWNMNAAKIYFQGPPNYWSEKEIAENVFERYDKRTVNATNYDKDSIMLYMFPGELFEDDKATNNNTALSKGDMEFIGKMYPK